MLNAVRNGSSFYSLQDQASNRFINLSVLLFFTFLVVLSFRMNTLGLNSLWLILERERIANNSDGTNTIKLNIRDIPAKSSLFTIHDIYISV